MRHRKKGSSLSRKAQPRKAMLRNMATSFVMEEKIKTTTAKAKVLKPIIEKLITLSGRGDLHARRQLLAYLYTEKAVRKMMDVIGPRYKERPGGYTRIVKLGCRQGDGANMAIIELV